MRLHGIERDAWNRYRDDGSWRYDVLEAGLKYNLSDLQAAIGIVQLRKCDEMQRAREEIALRYSSAFSTLDELQLPEICPDRRTSWHLYILRLRPGRLGVGRNDFISALRTRGVGCSVHFIPLHLQSYDQRAYGYKVGDFPNAEQQQPLSVPPDFPGMTDLEIEHVIQSVRAVTLEFRINRTNAASSSTTRRD